MLCSRKQESDVLVIYNMFLVKENITAFVLL